MRAFLSHISDEASEARSFKTALEAALPGSEVFVSATDIHWGDAWLKEIDEALTSAKVILVLCSPHSVPPEKGLCISYTYLFYRVDQSRLLCAVVKRLDGEGFLITAYPCDKVKEGDRIWPI